MAEFVNLEILEINEIEEVNLCTISQFIGGELGRLTELRCKTAKFHSIDWVMDYYQLAFLARFYESLRRTANPNNTTITSKPVETGPGNFMLRTIRNDLSIVMNGVEVDLKCLEFGEYHFEMLISKLEALRLKLEAGSTKTNILSC